MSDEKDKHFFIFVHIPKCAGTSFHDILRRNLGSNYLYVSHGLYESPVDSNALALYISENSQRQGIGGHRLSLDVPFDKFSNIKVIGFVRDVISRLRSEYFYVKSLPGNVGQNSLIREFDYCEYLNYLIDNQATLNKMGAYQTQFLFGQLNISFEYIKELISSEKLFLFPVERFNDACIFLENAFPDQIRDASYILQNSGIIHDISSFHSLEEQIRKELKQDNDLFQIANQQLELLVSKHFTNNQIESLRKNFLRRCTIRKYLYHPLHRVASKIHKMTL